ncbi:MAG: hypothetical protein Kow0099_02550 [Candidatus Abyssubacteria bacterium]
MPDIEWRKIVDMRNIAHQYFGVDKQIVWDWDIVQNKLPSGRCVKVLSPEFGPVPSPKHLPGP